MILTADTLLATAAAIALLDESTTHAHVRLRLGRLVSVSQSPSQSLEPCLAISEASQGVDVVTHRLLCDNRVERDGLHGLLLLRGVGGRHIGW